MSDSAQIIFWVVLGIAFGLLGLWSWLGARGSLQRLGKMRDDGPMNYLRTTEGEEIADTVEIFTILNLMSWTGTIGFILAGVAAIFTAVS